MSQKIPNKLVFSTRNPKRRKRSFVLISVLAVLQICLIWPVYPLFSSPRPLILGIPLSFAWVILILLLSFTALLIFFRIDTEEEE